jgi:hypothetical protein
MEMMARLGYGARGTVYLLVGALAVLAAIGRGGGMGGSKSALAYLMEQPFGWVLVGVLALGLLFFGAWRLLEAATDADGHGSEAKGLAIRAAHGISGVVYLGLAASAAAMASGYSSGGGSEGQATRDWTALLMSQPLGRWLVAGLGVVVVGAGIGFAVKGFRGDVMDRLSVPPGRRGWASALGRAGFSARGIVFVVMGGFLVLAAWQARSSAARGLGGALEALSEQPYGKALLALTAAGLAAFGAFGLVQARYRRVRAPEMTDLGDAAMAGMRSLRRAV